MLGFEMAMLDAVAHATMSIAPPGIERSVASFVASDIADAVQKQLEAGEERLEKIITDGLALRSQINATKREVSREDLPLLDRVISVADRRLKERARFFDRERKLVPRYRRFVASHFPDQLKLYDTLEPRWSELRRREHGEIVDFLCFLRVIRSEIDEDGRTVVATFSDARTWNKSAGRLVN
jgi:hypothetical protein